MNTRETLRTLSRMMAALREHASAGEITYQCGDWKMADRINGNGSVTNLYTYRGEPESLYPLTVTLFALGRAHVVTIKSDKELCTI